MAGGALMSKADLRAKIAWEGGIAATLDYGLSGGDIADLDLAAAWDKLARPWEVYSRAADAFLERLKAAPNQDANSTGGRVSAARLRSKIDWEGTTQDAIMAGITPEQIADPKLAAAWGHLIDLWEAVAPALADMDRRLRS